MRAKLKRTAALLALFLAAAGDLAAQASTASLRVSVGVEPAVVTIGEPFRSALRVTAPAGTTVEYGSVEQDDPLEAIAPPRLSEDSAGALVATYELVAWVTGDSLEAIVPVRLIAPDGVARTQPVRLRLPSVRSVLPAGEAAVQPRPAKALFVPPLFGGWSLWWLLAILLAGLVAGLIGYRLLAERRREEETPVLVDPREWALLQLEALGSGEEGPADLRARVARASWILRTYLYRIEPEWSADLTTTELLARVGSVGADPAMTTDLAHLLARADRAKFAGGSMDAAEVAGFTNEAKAWVRTFPPAAGAAEAVERAA